MQTTLKRKVIVQAGGRIEVVDDQLPPGSEAEVTIEVAPTSLEPQDCLGAFADDSELIDQIVEEAMAIRGSSLRIGRG